MKMRDTIHTMKRRCNAHDYCARAIYMITIEVAGRAKLLGRIIPENLAPQESGGEKPLFEPSKLGKLAAEEFMRIGEHIPEIQPLLAQPMPDHFHGILFVRSRTSRPLGSIIAGYKGHLTSTYRKLNNLPNDCSLWEKGFHDRILTAEGQLETLFSYVRDNPRRAALKKLHRDLFTSLRCIAENGQSFDAFGNEFLLKRPEIVQVQCSRSFFAFARETKASGEKIARGADGAAIAAKSTPEFEAKRDALFQAAERGAVLCSPCISDGEKAIAYAAIDAGHPLIVLRNEPFPPLFKPSGRFFDACAQGKLLMLHPAALTHGAPNRPGARITRAECLALNAIAASLSRRSIP